MSNNYLTPSAVIVLLIRKREDGTFVLCQRRNNTGFADGMFDFSCSGKVEMGESMRAAAVREAREELGLNIEERNLRFMSFVYKRDVQFNVVYCNAYFICEEFKGEPIVGEPQKCSQIEWYDLSKLPPEIMDDRRTAFEEYQKGNFFVEYGW